MDLTQGNFCKQGLCHLWIADTKTTHWKDCLTHPTAVRSVSKKFVTETTSFLKPKPNIPEGDFKYYRDKLNSNAENRSLKEAQRITKTELNQTVEHSPWTWTEK